MNILAAIDDPRLFGNAIKDPATWLAWRAFQACLFALPMTAAEEAIAEECTGLTVDQRQAVAFGEAWLVCGRRSGKSFVLALIAVYLACFRSYEAYLTIGERGTIPVIASDRKQARTILRYIRGLLGLPMFKAKVERETADGFDLKNRITIEVITSSVSAVRSYTCVAALCDEIAFWSSDDSVNPGKDILRALRPGGLTIPNFILLVASSPYAQSGPLWEAYTKYHGKPHATSLVWKAPTLRMNPTVPAREIEKEYEADPISAACEYGAEFRQDIEGYIGREPVEAVTMQGVAELPPCEDVRYQAFVDAASGSGGDSMTWAISHRDKSGTVILDLLRERKPPFNTDAAVGEAAGDFKRYRVHSVTGDRWAKGFVDASFSRNGITYKESDKTKSQIYRDLIPLINSKSCQLLDNTKMVTQLLSLVRTVARGGSAETIDHPRGSNHHDDLCNAAAGALTMASKSRDFHISNEDLDWASTVAQGSRNWHDRHGYF